MTMTKPDKTVYLTYGGIRLPLTEWAKRVGLPRQLVANRISYGWSADEALNTPTCDRVQIPRYSKKGTP